MSLNSGRRKRAIWWWVVLFTLQVDPAEAEQQVPPTLDLSWTAPSACPTKRAVEDQIFRLAPRPREREQPLRVQGTVRKHDGVFALELVLRDGKLVGHRRFESESCAEVVGAAAVTVALLLSAAPGDALELSGQAAGGAATTDDAQLAPAEDRAADSDNRDTTSERTESSAPAPANTTADERKLVPQNPSAPDTSANAPPKTGSAWRLLLAAPTGTVGVGFLSTPSLGVGAGIGLELDPWRLLLSGTWNINRRVHPDGSSEPGADVSRRTARLAACRWLGHSRIQLAPCASVALESMTARGTGADVSGSKAAYFWVALGPELSAGLSLSDSVRLAAGVALHLQTARPTLTIEGFGPVEQVGALELGGWMGAEWIF